MAMPSLRRYAAAAGLIVLMFSIQVGNWVGYALCMAGSEQVSAEIRDCGCDVYLAMSSGLPGSGTVLERSGFKSVAVEGMPVPTFSWISCIDQTTQRGLQSPTSLYPDPFADPHFRPPGKAC